MTWLSRRSALTQCLIVTGLVLAIAGAIDMAHAAPFGASGGPAQPDVGGFTGWVLHQHNRLLQAVSGVGRLGELGGIGTSV